MAEMQVEAAAEMTAGLVVPLSLAHQAAAEGQAMMKTCFPAQAVLAEHGEAIRQAVAQVEGQQAAELVRLAQMLLTIMDVAAVAEVVALMQILPQAAQAALADILAAEQVAADVVTMALVEQAVWAETAQLEFIHGR